MPSAAIARYASLTRHSLVGKPVGDAAEVSIDFSDPHPESALGALSFGSCISTFSGDGQGVNIIKGGAAAGQWKAMLAGLGRLVWRIPLAWNDGHPGSAAAGARSYDDARDYLQAIRDIGGTPMVAIGGRDHDNDIDADDAARLVRYLNEDAGGEPVQHWIVGNEPDNGFGLDRYLAGGAGCSGFNAIAAAMRAASSRRLSIAGPALVEFASYKQSDFETFLDSCGAQADRIDFHQYGRGLGISGNLATVAAYGDAVQWLAGAVAQRPATAGRVRVQVGEFNFHPFYDSLRYGGDAFYTSRNTVHTAAAIGHVVESGGDAYHYSDNNGPLGLITPGNGDNGAPTGRRLPMPSYHGLRMWTGGSLFRRPTGSLARVRHDVEGLDVFATTAVKNVVVVNRSETVARTLAFDLGAFAGRPYTIWQTVAGLDPGDPAGPQWASPRRVAGGTLSRRRLVVRAPAMTVSCLLLD